MADIRIVRYTNERMDAIDEFFDKVLGKNISGLSIKQIVFIYSEFLKDEGFLAKGKDPSNKRFVIQRPNPPTLI